jgi:predicted dehydrogenase
MARVQLNRKGTQVETVGIIMNGVTGRMGTNQHLERSIAAIRRQGGVLLSDGRRVLPDPILLGRNPGKLDALAQKYALERWSTSLDDCLSDPRNLIYFDAQATSQRAASVRAALAAGKHVYCEKPLTGDLDEALELARLAAAAGVKHGIVQDKLFLPGFLKLKQVIESGFLGRILSVRGEFGYWVFEGGSQPAQRPSWNYRKQDGGGIILDMFPHWQYLLENLFGAVTAVSCLAATHIPERFDESGVAYAATADDSVYATFELESGVIVQMNSSWCTRVHRDDLLILHVDGEEGSAVAGLRECEVQHRSTTPRAVWNPDAEDSIHYLACWQRIQPATTYENAFKIQWEMFLRHVLEDAPFPHDFLQAARGVQFVEAGLRSSQRRNWQKLTPLTIQSRES